MRRVRYAVAASLDGFIAGPKGEADWIIMDPDIDFGEIFKQFDTFLIGRRTFEAMGKAGQGSSKGIKTFVFSSTLRQQDHPKVTIVAPDKAKETVSALRSGPGKDIWLFGGGGLFRSLAEMGLVDTVEVGLIPVLLGGGIPLFPPPAPRTTLTLTKQRLYEKTGILGLEYAIAPAAARGGSKKRR
jgi:dihydrofolate reductase